MPCTSLCDANFMDILIPHKTGIADHLCSYVCLFTARNQVIKTQGRDQEIRLLLAIKVLDHHRRWKCRTHTSDYPLSNNYNMFIYLQDLHQFFPYLLSNIFGFGHAGGWGLCTFNRTLHSDFDRVLQFLLPGGDIFQLIAKLDADNFIYEFPIECLPVSSATACNTSFTFT